MQKIVGQQFLSLPRRKKKFWVYETLLSFLAFPREEVKLLSTWNIGSVSYPFQEGRMS